MLSLSTNCQRDSFLCHRHKWLPTKNQCSWIRPIQLLPPITWCKVIIHKHSERRWYKSCKKVFRQPSKANSSNTKVITTFLAFILTLDNFIFNSRNYLQTKGCAMGTICAPSCANIFMDHFEKITYIPIYQRVFINISQIYWRHTFYMDWQ